MDYFFWDEIFGGRQGLGDYMHDGPEPLGTEPTEEQVSVIITYVETFQGPQSG